MGPVAGRPIHPADEPTAVAVVRAWFDGGPRRVMKVRVTNALDAGSPHHTIGVATDASGACRLIEEWLTAFAEANGVPTEVGAPTDVDPADDAPDAP